MIELYHQYSLKGEWQAQAAERMNTILIQNKTTILPNHFAKGISYFNPITKGISIVLLDAIFTKEVIIKRLTSDDDLYILQFDLSEKINKISIKDSTINPKKTDFKSGFSVLHTSIENSFTPVLNQRTFAIRLLVEKQLLHDLLIQKNKKLKTKNIQKKILFYNHINSKNKILINSIKDKHVFDIQFDSYIRGISLKLFANFIDTFTKPTKQQITKVDAELINSTTLYLSANLHKAFPSISFLSNMARMSQTKYKILFMRINHMTPNHFFNDQKLNLARTLLQSGTFNSITEISELLNYSKPAYFTQKYLNHFKEKPSKDFVKKKS